jgi:hypothetical protein
MKKQFLALQEYKLELSPEMALVSSDNHTYHPRRGVSRGAANKRNDPIEACSIENC